MGRNVTIFGVWRLSRKRVHQPAYGYADQQEERKRPRGIFEAFLGSAAPQRAKGEGNNESEQRHGLEVSERSGHSRSMPFARVRLRRREGRPGNSARLQWRG